MSLCKALIDQVKDEEKGIHDYFQLQKMFPSHQLTLESIRMDEQKHKELLEQIMEKEGCL